ncbi:MAG: hypothetical protein KJ630_18380 [Proteobacteria bacterium]|nr:hypothetical protein [Pseudomonadota bacterium]
MQALLHKIIKRTTFPPNSGRFLVENRNTLILSLTIFILAFLFRSWQNILNPGLYWEDAGHYFNIYYGIDRDLSFILQNPNGYYNILNNFVAWLAQHLDVRIQPTIYLAFALTMGVITATSFSFSGLIQNRFLLLVTPLVLGLSGMNHIFYFNTLTFQMYNVVVVLLCLLFLPPTRSPFVLFVLCVVITVLVWSGPYSVVALPVALALLVFFHNREKTILFVYVIINLLIYTFSVKAGTIMLSNIANKDIRNVAVHTLFERVFFLDLLGAMSSIKVGLFFLFIVSIFYYLRKNVFFIKISLAFFIIILAALAPLFLSIKYLLYQQVFTCHIYVSQFFWLCFILFSADQLIKKAQPKPAIQVFIAVMFCCLVLFDNIRHQEKGRIDLMPTIPDFVKTIYLVEQLELAKKNQYVLVKTDNLIPGYMPPMVRVGSWQDNAQRLSPKEIPIASGKQFIIE